MDSRISTLDVCPLRIVEVRINITNIRSYLCVCVSLPPFSGPRKGSESRSDRALLIFSIFNGNTKPVDT